MSYSFTEKKRIRKSFSKTSSNYDIPDLLKIQLQAYVDFLQKDVNDENRKNQGLQAAFNSIFPIEGTKKSAELQFISYSIDEPIFSVKECLMRGLTYCASLKAKLRLVLFDKNSKTRKVKTVIEDEVYFSTIPLMTNKASFVINGTERVVVSQLHRSPGVIFESDKGRTYRGKTLFTSRIIPYRGSWLDFEFDQNDCLFVRIDCKKKLPLSVFLRCLNYSNEQMIQDFSTIVKVSINSKKSAKETEMTSELDLNIDYLQGEILTFDIKDGQEVVVKAGSRITAKTINAIKKTKIKKLKAPLEYLHNHVYAKDIVDESTGEVIAHCNERIDDANLSKLLNAGIYSFNIAYFNDSDCNPFISNTLNIDSTKTRDEALTAIYRVIRPGEIPTLENAETLFESLFQSEDRYDLSAIGRMKINRRLGRDTVEGSNLLSNEDILDVIKNLIKIRLKNDLVDDIDTLNNRRIRSVGEMAENQFRSGLFRVERVVRERLNNAELEGYTPKDLINSKPMTSAFREFFSTNQLSQFMDQVNPLAEVTHKRRVSAFGVGGLSRERAGFEVRDVHPSHYGRLCPVETPEGPNIGLINSLALYSSINEYGFLETQFRKVVDAKVTEERVVLSSIDETDYVIAQANTETDKNGKIIGNLISCRKNGEVGLYHPSEINLIDISPRQVFSAATALIPFLEHDDANRALMGSNMQRQAVPLLKAEKPLVGTGMERSVALNSRVCIVAERSGKVVSTDASRIVIKVNSDQVEKGGQSGVDIYNLEKYTHSNQNTCLNQIPLVKIGDEISKGDVLADGSATDIGELALGKNVLVAFMPWNGYNFEDSILISENLVAKESYSSIHIEEFIVYARDTRLGAEEITNDIPNVSESALSKLDSVGIIRVGAEVNAGDILVGKVTPKGESSLNPEEKLLRAIFGEKASEVKDTSLRAKSDTQGKVIDVRIYTRSNEYKDERCLEIEAEELSSFRKDLDEKFDIMTGDLISQAKNEVVGKTLKKSIKGIAKAKEVITDEIVSQLSKTDLLDIETTTASSNEFLTKIKNTIDSYKRKSDEIYKQQCKKVQDPCDLPTGVIKAVKISIAVKKHLQPGDKMAGRHGNKGVISRICPIEDMPFTEDGRAVDVVLNPLGVPSRMNVGQVLEVHLGFAARELGRNIDEMLRKNKNASEVKAYLQEIYNMGSNPQSIESLNSNEVKELANNLRDGVPVETPIFDGAKESEIKNLLKFANLPESGQVKLFDGTTGEEFDNPVTIGYMYMLKLNHLADDKMHARATGPYSLVTQQPLGGKAHYGGQRFGEMEVWALEAYGASHILQEMLTVKSDDTVGRSVTYRNIVNQNYNFEARVPESFNVLIKEIQALALDIDLREDQEI